MMRQINNDETEINNDETEINNDETEINNDAHKKTLRFLAGQIILW